MVGHHLYLIITYKVLVNLFYLESKSSTLAIWRPKAMLPLFFSVAFSAVPLILYIPPLRSLNLFVETIEDMARESRIHTNRIYPRLRVA
ncbi:hypothetical protein JHK85_044518 [Glycine max]|nr:hypothetical protein JHK85_044518 [Glycine max]